MKRLLYLALTCISISCIVPLLGWLLQEDPGQSTVSYTDAEVSWAVQAREDFSDMQSPLVLYRDVDYSLGAKGSWFPKNESPRLAKEVELGLLHPLVDRIGTEPAVVEGVDGTGKYGGAWIRAVASIEESAIAGRRMPGVTLVRWSPHGHPIVPHLAKSWRVSSDSTVWEFELRKGVRWSDGAPLTADDFIYWWKYEINSKVLGLLLPRWLRLEDGSAPKIDLTTPYTIRFRFQSPNPNFLIKIASSFGEYPVPRHYLQKFHPTLGDQKYIEEAMRRENIPTARELYNFKKRFLNPEHPRLWAWIPEAESSFGTQIFVRNPYYWSVDTSGNQLPYIDSIIFHVKNVRLVPVSASNGEITMQAGNYLKFEDYTLLMAQRKPNDYEVYHWLPASRSVWTLYPNLNRRTSEGRKEDSLKRELLNQSSFRQALSLAIDRKKIIQSVYQGVGEPAQLAPGPHSQFHHEALYRSYVEHDPSRASALLDGLGLTRYDREGYRCFSDGSKMIWFIDFTRSTGQGPAQFVVDGWKEIGVRAIARENSRSSMSMKKQLYDFDFYVHRGASEFDPITDIRNFVPVDNQAFYAAAYGDWYSQGGFFAPSGAPATIGESPPAGHPLRRCMELYNQMLLLEDQKSRMAVLDQIFGIHARELFTISIASPPPQLVIVDRNLKNVPRQAIFGFRYRSPGNAGVETFYFTDRAKAHSRSVDSAAGLTLDVRKTSESKDPTTPRPNGYGGYLVLFAIAAGIVWPMVRYRYLRGRIVIMMPQLCIISVAVFVIIQVPPGSYVEKRILELRESGRGDAAIEEIESLRKDFHLDEPLALQYARWSGLYWFTTFKTEDKGLLQGFLGRSMKDRRTVNSIAGERILLTVMIALCAITLTWALAIPAGVLAAVRQHTTIDYTLTFIGMLGLSVPNFLLVLVLIFLAGKFFGLSVTGFGSIEYLGVTDWSLNRVIDLLKHLWLPVLVLGVSGTAGMIRVMRANLLDELRKPYITTAKAKGVKPVPCIVKYPFRLAINPFISGIGGIFPALVSGGAIVAIVMGLPTIGPLLLEATMDEDVYVAASLLMIINTLAIMGVLLSDLLLIALDPRIRLGRET